MDKPELNPNRVALIVRYLEFSLGLDRSDRLAFVFGIHNPEEDLEKQETCMEYYFKLSYQTDEGFSDAERDYIEAWCRDVNVYLKPGYEGDRSCCFYQASQDDFCVQS